MKNRCLTCEHYQYHKRVPEQYEKALREILELHRQIDVLVKYIGSGKISKIIEESEKE